MGNRTIKEKEGIEPEGNSKWSVDSKQGDSKPKVTRNEILEKWKFRNGNADIIKKVG